MRNHLLIILAMAAPAAAQPITQPSSCEVTISRAPDEVREAIEAWVNAEPRCSTTLDIRVVVTEGGFYMFARDDAGRIRERVVPDAQSAGVLVASWVADDLIARAAPPPTAAPMPPSATPVVAVPAEAAAVVATAQPSRTGSRWLTLGATMQVAGAVGLRGELDVMRRGKWTLGAILAGAYSEFALGAGHPLSPGQFETTDVALLAVLSRTSSFGKWSMRLSLGAGLLRTHVNGYLAGEPLDHTAVTPTAEASILFAREVFDDWAFTAGPIVTMPVQSYTVDESASMVTFSRRGIGVIAFGGLRRRL